MITTLGMDMDTIQLLDDLATRDLCLSTVSATRAGKGFRRESSCMYVRPSTAWEVSFKVLYDMVGRLVGQCRCGACFGCLERAGCLRGC